MNVWGGTSSDIVHFFFQYWNGVPFGVGIVVFPFVVMAMIRLVRRIPWITFGLIAVPFVGFWVYWGSSHTGLLREGLHPWFLTLILLFGIEITPILSAGGRGALTLRVVLLVRVLECLVMMTFPTLVRSTEPGVDVGVIAVPTVPSVPVTNTAAWLLMAGGLMGLAVATLRVTEPTFRTGAPLGSPWWAALSARSDPRPRFDTPAMREIASGWAWRGGNGPDNNGPEPGPVLAQDRVTPHTID